MSIKKILSAFALAAVMAVMSPFSTNAAGHGNDVVHVAIKDGNFKTLVTAIKAAGLEETLMGEGPFTVFAPTDEAFAKLPDGTVEDLLKPENKDKLVSILTYHVVPGKVLSTDLAGKKMDVKSVQGSELMIDATDGVTINDARVIKADVMGSNGVVHVVDTVIIPQ
jgi:uncharacterized surface protein with fasciclin (FAS1) repeats